MTMLTRSLILIRPQSLKINSNYARQQKKCRMDWNAIARDRIEQLYRIALFFPRVKERPVMHLQLNRTRISH